MYMPIFIKYVHMYIQKALWSADFCSDFRILAISFLHFELVSLV